MEALLGLNTTGRPSGLPTHTTRQSAHIPFPFPKAPHRGGGRRPLPRRHYGGQDQVTRPVVVWGGQGPSGRPCSGSRGSAPRACTLALTASLCMIMSGLPALAASVHKPLKP